MLSVYGYSLFEGSLLFSEFNRHMENHKKPQSGLLEIEPPTSRTKGTTLQPYITAELPGLLLWLKCRPEDRLS
jgi:hypothetical protein